VKLERPLSEEQAATLTWLLRETYAPHLLTPASQLPADAPSDAVVEVQQCPFHLPRSMQHAGMHAVFGSISQGLTAQACSLALPCPRLGMRQVK
jgi:hypothetical protein